MGDITYQDKDKHIAANSRNKWLDKDANEVKRVVNSKLDKAAFTGYTATTILVAGISGATNLGGVGLFTSIVNRNLRLKGLEAGVNITLTPTSTGITISSTGGGGGSSIYTGATPSTVIVGGINPGYQLTGKTSNQILEQMLVVYQIPAFIALSITGQASPIEVGIGLSGIKTFTWSTSNSANVQPNSIAIRNVNTNTLIASGLANDGSEAVSIGTITNTSPISQSWRGEGTNTHAGSFQSSNFTVTSLYPYFYGKVSSGGAPAGGNRPSATNALVTGGTKVVASSSGSIVINFNTTSNDYMWFAHPASVATKTTWVLTSLNNGSIGGGVSPGGNLFPDPNTISVTTVLWVGISYKVYIANYQSTANTNMTIS